MHLLVGFGDALQLIDEVHVPGRPAELPVRRGLQPDLPLHGHDVADAVILDLSQRVCGDLVCRGLRPRPQQDLGAEQAADVVGAERWLAAPADRAHTDSTSSEMPWPTPMHMVANPRRAPRSRIA